MNASTRLLIVDDDLFVRTLLKDALGDANYSFAEAADGEEALAQLKASKPDVVLLDLFMPKMGGLQALTEIMQISPGQRVIIISSLDSETLISQAMDAGADGFVQKPFHPLEVQAAVKKALRSQG